jgi:hypothetical protein
VEKTRPLAKANMGKPRAKERRAVKAVSGEGEPNGTGQKQKGSPTAPGRGTVRGGKQSLASARESRPCTGPERAERVQT